MEPYDLVVIGAGPAGEKGAAQAAYFGKRVALIERGNVGGSMVNTGTLPSKTLRETALYLSGLAERGLYGVERSLTKDVTVRDLFYRRDLIAENQLKLIHENIDRHNIRFFQGTAALKDAQTVNVRDADDRTVALRGGCILITTGGRPHRPAEVPFDARYVYDSDDILELERIPSSLIVVGAGVIGSEYATVFAALGLPVTLVDAGSRLLPFIDGEIAYILQQRMRELGVELRFECRVESVRVEPENDRVSVCLASGEEIHANALLWCRGRDANSGGLGLEALGIRTGRHGAIQVNDSFQTAVPNIYAAGDVIGFPALASTSMEQARVAVCHAFCFEYKKEVSSLIPYGIYTIPEISMVGESEDSLRASGEEYLVGRASYRINPRGQIIGDTSGLVKLLFRPADQRLLGVHIIGEHASELIHIGQACLFYGGTIDFFIQSVFNFPALSDLYKYAAYDGLGNLQRYRAAK